MCQDNKQTETILQAEAKPKNEPLNNSKDIPSNPKELSEKPMESSRPLRAMNLDINFVQAQSAESPQKDLDNSDSTQAQDSDNTES